MESKEFKEEKRKNLLNDPIFMKSAYYWLFISFIPCWFIALFARNQTDLEHFKEEVFAEANYLNAFEIESPKKKESSKTKKIVKNTIEEHNELGLLSKKVELLEAKVFEKNSMLALLHF